MRATNVTKAHHPARMACPDMEAMPTGPVTSTSCRRRIQSAMPLSISVVIRHVYCPAFRTASFGE